MSVTEDQNLSIPRSGQHLGLSAFTTWTILQKDIGLRTYKIQLVQKLDPNDHLRRRVFSDWVLNQLTENLLFNSKNHLQ